MARSLEKATFAAGCFWGVEKFLGEIPGVVETEVGYAGGTVQRPSYERVVTGRTGHAESVQVTFDPERVSYDALLERFWRIHDPTQLNRQGPDIGTQYRSAIFYHTPEQESAARHSKEILDQSGFFKDKIVTEIVPVETFYTAEGYHQDYLQKNPGGYCSHRLHSEEIATILRSAKQKF